ncbi:MAG: PglZ domain-containing protein, partial [Prevotella sp.]|nr:PglZ domain-containing protein [Prevotella sp.]
IKPVNPMQILLSIKKNIHSREIVTEVTQTGYQQNFQNISMKISDCRNIDDWKEVYKLLVRWELELSATHSSMTEMLKMQKEEANLGFAKFIKKNYMDWVAPTPPQHPSSNPQRPTMSPDIFKTKIFPLLDKGEKVFLIVIDNFRFDQWRVLAEEIGDMFDIEEDLYTSILPTATQYARNAIFSGLMPQQIAKMFPELWVDEDEDEGKNLNEAPLIKTQIERYRRHDTFSYHKINDSNGGDKLMQQFKSLQQNSLNVVVINFIDMLSHARTESKMVRELANNESAYRSISLSWFKHSVLSELFTALAQTDYRVILTTDHGSIRADRPVKIVGDRNTNTNLRYKLGKNLSYNSKDLFVIKEPQKAQLPAPNLSTSYVFATGNDFFAYPNNYNYYVQYYKDTFQHGGISMEEMLIPLITMKGRKK